MATKTETKTTTASTLASKIKLDNILQLTLVQSTLQANFKAIIEALSEHDSELQHIKDETKNNHDGLVKLGSSQEAMMKEIQSLKDMLSKLAQESSSIKVQIAANEVKNTDSPNPESKLNTNELDQINKQINVMKDRENKIEANAAKNAQDTKLEIEKLRKDIAEISKMSDLNGRIKDIQKFMKDMETKNKEMASKIKQIQSQANQNQKNGAQLQDLSQQLKELNKKLQDFTNVEYKNNNESTNERISQLEKLLQDTKAVVEEQKRLKNKLSQQLWKVHETVSKVSDNNFSQQIINDTLKQLKRQVGDLQKRMNQLSSYKGGFNDTTLHESPSKFRITDGDSPAKAQSANNSDLREQMLERLKQLKADIMKNLKKMDFKNEGESAYDKKRLDAIDQAILRLDHLIAEKAGIDSVKKLIGHLENKISYIYNVFMGESEEDACIARKNWVCLSCDKKLDKYQGKVGQYLVNDKLKIKTLDQDTVGGGMTLKPSKSRVDLPHVYSKTAKRT